MIEPSFQPPVPGEGRYTVTLRDAAGKVIAVRRNQVARKDG